MTSTKQKAVPIVAVVDDDEDLRSALADLLESVGYGAPAFGSAESFLGSELRNKVDCVISDIQMQGASGLELARAVRSTHVPVILVTAFPTPEIAKQAENAGVRRLLLKPFNSQSLIDDLRELFAQER